MDHAMLIRSLKNNGLLPVFKSNDVFIWQNLIDVCYQTGLRVIEFRDTRDTRGLKIFPHLVAHANRYENFHIGVNTIRNLNHCEQYLKAGAAYISSPFLNPGVGLLCHQYNALWIPGSNGMDDISYAIRMGADIVSVLPGSSVRELPEEIGQAFPLIPFIPSSGHLLTDSDGLRWLRAGALCLRSETKIFPEMLIAVKDWFAVKRLIYRELELVKSVPAEVPALNYSIL